MFLEKTMDSIIIIIIIIIYPGKKHSWLEKGSREWFTVVNSYPTEDCDYQT